VCSPVSRRASGECNAITSRGFGHSGLTFVSALEPRSALPISPFVDSFRGATTRELTLSFCRRPEGESRRLDLAMIDPTEQLLEILPRIAAVKTRQRLDFLIPTHAVRNE
jgi:hypothetical protein